jgi:hypothetical protein
MAIKKDDDWIAKPLLDKLIEATPRKSLFDLVMENPGVEVFTCYKDIEELPGVHVAADSLKEAILYVMHDKKPAIVITEKTYSKIDPGPDCMQALKLHSVIRQAEYSKDGE